MTFQLPFLLWHFFLQKLNVCSLFFFAAISFMCFYISCVVKIAPAGTSSEMVCTD